MDFIINKISLLITITVICIYVNKVSKKNILKRYVEKSISNGSYDKEYEKKLRTYLDKNITLMIVSTAIVTYVLNIVSGILFLIIMYIINPIPKDN